MMEFAILRVYVISTTVCGGKKHPNDRPRVYLEDFPFSKWLGTMASTWRIIPVSKWLVTPIYKPFRPFGREIPLLRGLTNHGY